MFIEAATEVVFRQPYWFEPEHANPGPAYTTDPVVSDWPIGTNGSVTVAVGAASLRVTARDVHLRCDGSREQDPTHLTPVGWGRSSNFEREVIERPSAVKDRYVSAPPGLSGRDRVVPDRTLRVSGDAWARASASVTRRSGRARER